MIQVLWVMAGGAIGAVGRYLFTLASIKIWGLNFPFGTLIVNALGSFFIGLIWGMYDLQDMKPGLKAFLLIGLLGGFTTFSAFSVETLALFKAGEMKLALLNILANNALSLLMVFLGYILGAALSKGNS